MTHRSTRNKLRWQVEKAVGNIDMAVEHMAKMDAIAEERSDYINQHVPGLVVLLEEVKKTLFRFREGL